MIKLAKNDIENYNKIFKKVKNFSVCFFNIFYTIFAITGLSLDFSNFDYLYCNLSYYKILD